MTSALATRVVEPGVSRGLDAAWSLKDRIRRQEGVLRQERAPFDRIYREATVYLRDGPEGELAGFAVARTTTGYLLLLAVSPDHRRTGVGSVLVDRVEADSSVVTCHVRVDNETALRFYRAVGFVPARRVPGYYRDDTDAYFLVGTG